MKPGWKNIAPVSILYLLKKTYEFKIYGLDDTIYMPFKYQNHENN